LLGSFRNSHSFPLPRLALQNSVDMTIGHYIRACRSALETRNGEARVVSTLSMRFIVRFCIGACFMLTARVGWLADSLPGNILLNYRLRLSGPEKASSYHQPPLVRQVRSFLQVSGWPMMLPTSCLPKNLGLR
jgi:hypothetical protein